MRSRRRSSGFVGILFILFGALFLADQFNLLRFGSIVATWWPAILILVGLAQFTERGRVRGSGLFLIGLGVVFLLITLGYLDWDVLGRLWPLALIAIGLSIMLARR